MFDPASPIGALWISIIAGIAAAGALATFHRTRGWLTPRLKKLALALPTPMQRFALLGAEIAIPWWRSYTGGSQRTASGTEIRLAHIHKARRAPSLLLLGATYVDLSLHPIPVKELRPGEHSGLDQVVATCGGSASWLGRHLWESYGRRSQLFTRIGSGDPLSDQLRKLIRKQKWIKGRRRLRGVEITSGNQCGVSVHLQQEGEAPSYHTTFTHVGVLRSFGWSGHIRGLQRKARRNAILYVSGFFRTNLQDDLVRYLRELSTNVFIIIDHGRFQSNEHPLAVSALRAAFQEGLIDAYVCTFSELRDLMSAFGLEPPGDFDSLLLEVAYAKGLLPRIVLVRGDFPGQLDKAYCLWDGEIIDEKLPNPTMTLQKRDRPGDKSAFTAGFLHGLSKPMPNTSGADSEEPEPKAILQNAMTEAVLCWSKQAQ